MIAIVDYGVGNLFSLGSSLEHIGCSSRVTADPSDILASDGVILPGVGAFGDAADKLRSTGLDVTVKEAAASGLPLLGICLGMQLLFEKSYEFGEHDGLGLIPGKVVPMRGVIPDGYKIPHIGWNSLIYPDGGRCPLFENTPEGTYVYFVHSFYAVCPPENLAASTDYGAVLTAAAYNGNIFGTQFHPEKSGEAGMEILRSFKNICGVRK
ncbi:MAG: imidazole glycerol phosphate synthase subunit HisH [Clostridia bacterium]|nr:imidazole glycerol phosphate synthase subunit HisH [Clostridia bacterium]